MGSKKNKKHRAAERIQRGDGRPPVVPQGLAELLSQGLTPEQLSDGKLLQQIAEYARGGPAVQTFTTTAPNTPPASDLPELEPDEIDWQDGTVPLRPGQVLDLHTRLYESLARHDPLWLNYLGLFIDDALKRNVESDQDAYWKWGVMFQPARTAEQYCGILARQLSSARTYQVTAKMVDVTDAMYQKSGSEVHAIQSEDVPWPSGFIYLDKPLVLADRHGREIKNRALSWNMEMIREDGDPDFEEVTDGLGRKTTRQVPPKPGVRISCWSWWSDQDDYWSRETGEIMHQMGGLSLAHAVILPLHREYRTLDERRAEGAPPDDVSRWLHALWLMMESEVPALRRAADIDRHSMNRARKSFKNPDVTVVLLRRTISKELEEGDPGHRYVDWSCRWVVQGFWRHQRKQSHHAVPDQTRNHCMVCGTAISWVRPHLRGPSDKPLKSSSSVYRLAR